MSYSIQTSLASLQARLIVAYFVVDTLHFKFERYWQLLIMVINAFLCALSIHNRIKENNTPIHKRAGDLNK